MADMKIRNSILLIVLFFTSIVVEAGIKPRFDGNTPMSVRYRMTQRYMKMRSANHRLAKIGNINDAPLKCTGSPKIPVVLVQFKDKEFSAGYGETVPLIFDLYFNGTRDGKRYQTKYSYGSVRDYFADQSDSLFLPEFVMIGPITLSRGYGYYGENTQDVTDLNINDFYEESIELTNKMNVDWNEFDNDGNGAVDVVFFLYAGMGENDSNNDDDSTIWPREEGLGGTFAGIKFGSYVCCNEESRGKLEGIGVKCHELSHALGLPDFYDENYIAYGMDYWDLMDSGCYCLDGIWPCGFSAYERDFMGWRKLETLEFGVGQNVTLFPVDKRGSISYKIVNPENPNEYYILENRQNDNWDCYIGDGGGKYGYYHGMMVSHVLYKPDQWTQNTVNMIPECQLMTLIPADSTLHSSMFYNEDYAWSMEENKWVEGFTYDFFEKSAAGDLYPGLTKKTDLQGKKAYVYTSTGATPHMMNQPITDITEHADGTITFKFCGGDATTVREIESGTTNNPSIYDMHGRLVPVDRTRLGNGVYIINGKKVLVR